MIGETVSHYRITEQIGSGGMEVVYKAKYLNFQRNLALNLLFLNSSVRAMLFLVFQYNKIKTSNKINYQKFITILTILTYTTFYIHNRLPDFLRRIIIH